jgi:hypothetical protein
LARLVLIHPAPACPRGAPQSSRVSTPQSSSSALGCGAPPAGCPGAMAETVEELRAENERLRSENAALRGETGEGVTLDGLAATLADFISRTDHSLHQCVRLPPLPHTAAAAFCARDLDDCIHVSKCWLDPGVLTLTHFYGEVFLIYPRAYCAPRARVLRHALPFLQQPTVPAASSRGRDGFRDMARAATKSMRLATRFRL